VDDLDDDVECIPVKTEPLNSFIQEPQHLQVENDIRQNRVENRIENSMDLYGEHYNEYEDYDGEGAEVGYDGELMTTNNVDENKELDVMISNTMVKDAGESGAWRCLICNVANKQKARIRNHVETHFEAQQICPICKQVCKSRAKETFDKTSWRSTTVLTD